MSIIHHINNLDIGTSIGIVPVILGFVIAYFRIFMPKQNDITDRTGKLKEKLMKKLSVKTENLLVDFYNLVDSYNKSFSPHDDIAQIPSLKDRQTKEFIEDVIRIINILKKADEIDQKTRRYSDRVSYSFFTALFIWVALILCALLSLMPSLWINIIAIACAVIILPSQCILVYCSRKNEKNLCDCEKNG